MTYSPTPLTAVRRHPERGTYDRDTVHAILDEALICHVGFVVDGQPIVIPTLFARVGETLYIHGSSISRMLTTLGEGVQMCVTATLLDGLVMARSAFSHSMNYRSVMVFGRGREVTDADEKWRALEATVEHVARGRWADARQPNDKELAVTTVIALAISEVSAKIRSGPPKDADADYALNVWAGVLPLALQPGAPVTDERSLTATPPPYVAEYRR